MLDSFYLDELLDQTRKKINYNDNLRIKKSHITHILCHFVIVSHAAVGQVKTFCHSWFYENGKKPLGPA